MSVLLKSVLVYKYGFKTGLWPKSGQMANLDRTVMEKLNAYTELKNGFLGLQK